MISEGSLAITSEKKKHMITYIEYIDSYSQSQRKLINYYSAFCHKGIKASTVPRIIDSLTAVFLVDLF